MWYGFKKQLAVTTQPLLPGEAPSSAPIKVPKPPAKPVPPAAPAGMGAGFGSAASDEQFIARSPQLNTSDKYDSRLADEPDEGSDTIAWWPLGGGYGEAGGVDDLEPNNE